MAHSGRRIFISAIAALLAIPASAAEIQHRTEYRVALAGLPIARAAFLTQIEDDHSYKIAGEHQFRRSCRSHHDDFGQDQRERRRAQ